ncbi:MAG: hypothetical protein ACI4RG_10680 [Huintestinicola sp.]
MNYKNKHIENAMNSIDNFLKSAKSTQSEYNALSNNYRGEELKRRRAAIMEQLSHDRQLAIEAIRNSYTELEKKTAALESAALDPAAITADFGFFNLPVTLTE